VPHRHRERLPKIERREMRFLTPAEVARLADSIRPGYRALVLLGAYGGLRIGEMAGLRRGRVDLDHGMVEVAEIVTEVSGYLHFGPPKTRAGYRRVGLPRVVVEALAEQLARPGSADDLVFVGPRWRCGSRPGESQGGRRPGRAHLGELHPGPLRPPLS
jgi:integrase